MQRLRIAHVSALFVVLALGGLRVMVPSSSAGQTRDRASRIPAFEYDPTWPKTLPNNWVTGEIGAMTVDSKDHIWVLQRPSSTLNLSERYGLEGIGECCFPAPPVMEFDMAGNLVQAWGPIHGDGDKGQVNAEARGLGPPGPWLLGKQVWGPFPEIGQAVWPGHEHGILVDYKDNVWVGDAFSPSHILKFTRDGQKLIMQLGRGGAEEGKSNADTTHFAGPTGIVVDPSTNEVFVADGYRNRRVIVFDADTGAYKRMWGAYGNRPEDPQGSNPIEGKYDPNVRSRQFATAHCLMMSVDRLLYVCDRINNRVQVFRTDGTFVKEGVVAPQSRGFGAVHALGFSSDKDQRFVYVGDGANKHVWILQRDDLRVVGSFGHGGRNGGQFEVIHALTVDSKGNVYVGETRNMNRVQKFKFMGLRSSSTTAK